MPPGSYFPQENEDIQNANTRPSRGHRWYFTRNGERTGPVTMADLKDLATRNELNPRLDFVWKHGMDDWKPAGEIDGLFERKTPPSSSTSSLAAAPAAPAAVAPLPTAREEPASAPLSAQSGWPGSSRRAFLFALVVLPALCRFAMDRSFPLFTAHFGGQLASMLVAVGSLIPLVVGAVVTVKRFHNLGMNGFWLLGFLVPILNIWLLYRCFACPAGYAWHGKLGPSGVVMATFYWLLLALLLIAFALVVAMKLEAIADPALRDQLENLLNTRKLLPHL